MIETTADQLWAELQYENNRNYGGFIMPFEHFEPYIENVAVAIDALIPKLPGLQYQLYYVASGHDVVTRVIVEGKNVKKFTEQELFNKSTIQSRQIIASLKQQTPEFESFVINNQTVGVINNFAINFLNKKFGPAIQAKLDALVPDEASLAKAIESVAANKVRSAASSHRQRLIRLSLVMRESNFSKDEVIEAWQLSQIEKVLET